METTERRRQVQEVFARASELPASERAAFLDAACAGDAWLRGEVDALLASFDEAGSFLEEPVSPSHVRPRHPRPLGIDVGQRIGPYLLMRPLAAGGMGSVYLAVRDDQEYRREVAVKLIRYGGEAPEFAARFRRERQLLAALEHPNIARLYEGGTAEDGRPYLVMEYVQGERIDDYCETHQLPVRERVALFRQVCEAVAYAHRRLVVHRDIKPSNILVGTDGVPKLLDFGIAKSLEEVGQTRPGRLGPMTLRYAAPEQIQYGPITTATDVYGLGLLLYRLLTEKGPYRLDNPENQVEVARAIVEQDPARPSAAVDAACARELRGDLDAIVLQALEKEPERRYRSAEALSEDLGRFLEGLPVAARGKGLPYVAGKLLRRYRVAATAAGVVLVVVGFFIAALVRSEERAVREQSRAAHERDKAAQEAEKARQTLGAFIDVFKSSDPERARGAEITAREILDGGAAKVRATIEDPEVKATLLSATGEVYVSLGLFEKAEALLQEALDLQRTLGGAEVAESLYQVAELEWWRRDYTAAEGYYREVLALLPAQETVERARVQRGLGLAIVSLGRVNDGEAMLDQAIDVLRGQFDETDEEVLRCVEGLAWAARDRGDYGKAEGLFRKVVDARRPGGPGPALGRSLAELGIVRYRQGALEDARSLLEEALPILRESMGTDNAYVAEVLGKLVAVLGRLGDDAGAEKVIREVLSILPENHPGKGTTLHNLGMILTDRGALEEAELVTKEAIRIQQAVFGETHENVALSFCLLGLIALESGNAESAREHYDACASSYPEGHPRLAFPWVGIGRSVEAIEGCAAAVQWYRRAYDVGREGLGTAHYQTAQSAGRLGSCLGRLGKYKEAEQLLVLSLEVLKSQDNAQRIVEAEERLSDLRESRRRKEAASQPSPHH